MSKYLKGNYRLPEQAPQERAEADVKPAEASIQEFERRALERLGGSIAFVMKRSTFVWKGNQPAAQEAREEG